MHVIRQHKRASHNIIYARVAQMKIWIDMHGKVGKKLVFVEILTDLS